MLAMEAQPPPPPRQHLPDPCASKPIRLVVAGSARAAAALGAEDAEAAHVARHSILRRLRGRGRLASRDARVVERGHERAQVDAHARLVPPAGVRGDARPKVGLDHPVARRAAGKVVHLHKRAPAMEAVDLHEVDVARGDVRKEGVAPR